MGGTIALLASQAGGGHDVLVVDMTDGCPTPVGNRPTRLAEAKAAMAELSPAGRPIRRVLLDLPNRRVEHTLAARHLVAGVIRAHQAQIIFCPHPADAHPDHIATTRIVEDARFDAKLTSVEMPPPPPQPVEYAAYGPLAAVGVGVGVGAPIYPKWLFHYYCSHLRRMPDPSFVIDTSSWFEAKKRSLLAYRSQFIDNEKNRGMVEWIDAQDRYVGSRIGARAGEGFFAKEPVGLTSLASLLQ